MIHLQRSRTVSELMIKEHGNHRDGQALASRGLSMPNRPWLEEIMLGAEEIRDYNVAIGSLEGMAPIGLRERSINLGRAFIVLQNWMGGA